MTDLRDSELGGDGTEVRLCKPAAPDAVPLIRATIAEFVRHRVPPARSYDIQLAVTEASTNVVRHAYPGGSGDLTCHAKATEDEIVIRICDPAATSARRLSIPASASAAAS